MNEVVKAWRHVRALAPAIGLFGGVAGMAACEADGRNFVVPIVSTGIVTAFKDSSFNFTTLHTFAMPDTVVHLAPLTGTPLDVSRQNDAVVLARVRHDFLARGYTEVKNPQTVAPDFVVLVGATATANYNAFVGYSWFAVWGFYPGWGWYAPGFNASWGIVYPWFPAVGVTAYDRGTLIVDLIPTATVNPLTNTVRSAWAGVATAAITDAVSATALTAAVDQMFALSPYLSASAVVPMGQPAR